MSAFKAKKTYQEDHTCNGITKHNQKQLSKTIIKYNQTHNQKQLSKHNQKQLSKTINIT